MTQLIPFRQAELPTIVQAKTAIDKADTIEKVNNISALFEAARVYASRIGDAIKQADAAEVKEYARRKIGLIYEKQKNPIGMNRFSESGADSLTTRQIVGSTLSAHQLQKARTVGRMTEDEFQTHVANLRENIINPKAKEAKQFLAEVERIKKESESTFNSRVTFILNRVIQALTPTAGAGVGLIELLQLNPADLSPADLDLMFKVIEACKQLETRANEWHIKLRDHYAQAIYDTDRLQGHRT